MNNKKILVVGAGFAGAVIARELADAGYLVTIIDKRPHIAGNCYDYVNTNNIRVHQYGPHIFHTSNLRIVEWLSRFTSWVEYKHKVKALLKDGRLVTLPVNAETAALVGKENIIETFIRPYSEKMWGIPLEAIDKNILARVAVREDNNEFYFPNDVFQALPAHGYTELFKRMLDHKNISIILNTFYEKNMDDDYFHIFNSMPIDEYFNYSEGYLDYRSIRFTNITLPIPNIFPVVTVNFTHTGPYTRVTEWKNLPNHGNNEYFTTITIEEPCDYKENNYERYYPVKDLKGKNKEIYEKYKLKIPRNQTFIGRCGQYIYLDMHQVINSSLVIAEKFILKNKN